MKTSLYIFFEQLQYCQPLIFFFFSFNILLLIGLFGKVNKNNRILYLLNITNISQLIAILSSVLLFIVILLLINDISLNCLLFNKMLTLNYYTIFFQIMILSFSIFCILSSLNYIKIKKLNFFEYHLLILITIFGSLLVVISSDFLILYLAIELVGLSLYTLSASKKESLNSTEASLKFIILGSFSSGIYLFGVSLIYGFTGLINFHDIMILLAVNNQCYFGIIFGMLFIFISILFKIGIVPFHMWIPDIYEGIPTTVTIFLTIIPKIAYISLLLRLTYSTFYTLIEYWQPLFSICGLLSIILGSYILVSQKKIKRFLAYSSIVHLGFILLGMSTGLLEGVEAVLLYLFIYMINSLNFWIIFLSLINIETKSTIIYLTDLNNLHLKNTPLSLILAISIFSMAGIPPIAGFFSKFFIFTALFQAKLYIFLIISAMFSILSAFYYLRIIKIIFFEEKKQNIQFQAISFINAFIIIISFLMLSFFFFNLEFFLNIIKYLALILLK